MMESMKKLGMLFDRCFIFFAAIDSVMRQVLYYYQYEDIHRPDPAELRSPLQRGDKSLR
jgi:hypothetical protein